jgi:hypothetical protein
MSLTAEQRRALAMLAKAGRSGVTQGMLSALGFDAGLIASLVDQGLATLTTSKARVSGKTIEVGKVKIKAAGRHVLAE